MAIRRRRTSRGASGSTQAAKSGGGIKAMQNTVWEWLDPTLQLPVGVNFNLNPYESPDSLTGLVTVQDVINLMNSGNFAPCSFPVYPRAQITGMLVRTNIAAFTQYAGLTMEEIPASLVEQVRVDSDKGFYIGCDDGTANVSQSDVRLRAYPKIHGIMPYQNNEVIVALFMDIPAEQCFVTTGNQPFYPYNFQTTQIGGVPFLGDAYLNQGQISVTGVRAVYIEGNKSTSPTSLIGPFNFTLGG